MIVARYLDEDYNLIKTADYINLQWIRRYYEAGEFEMLVPASDFPADAAFIYTPDRPEMGRIQKRHLTDGEEGVELIVGGFFLEEWLDDKVIMPTANKTGTVEECANWLVDTYKQDIPVTVRASNIGGLHTRFQSRGAHIGTKAYEILRHDEMSYRIVHDYESASNYFEVYQGKDRTDTQTENNRVVFSTQLGNVLGVDSNIDESDYRNFAYIMGEGEGAARVIEELDASNGAYKREMTVDARDLQSEDEDGNKLTDAEYKEALLHRGAERMAERNKVEDNQVIIDPFKKGRQYLIDFDIGDRVDVIIKIDSFGIEIQQRITEIYEVVKDNSWEVEITIGNKLPEQTVRAGGEA